jgi:hydroxymethylglutaryl-CoA lyase
MSPRDGLQYLGGPDAEAAGRIVPLERRVDLIEALIGAGLRYIEVGAFVSPKGTPQMALSDLLGQRLDPGRAPGLELAGLVPNEAGYRRFRTTRLNVVAIFPSASEAHSRTNFGGRSVDQVLALAGDVGRQARADGYAVRGHVSAAFQDMAVVTESSDLATVVRVCRTVLDDFGCEYLTLADTNGTTNPARIGEVLDAVGDALGGLSRVGVHLHDRYGTGIANAYAAWLNGVKIFDASLGAWAAAWQRALSLEATAGRWWATSPRNLWSPCSKVWASVRASTSTPSRRAQARSCTRSAWVQATFRRQAGCCVRRLDMG